MRTRLGISIGLFAAGIYFAAFFGGYIPVILLGGYALLFEQNEWLRRSAVKAFATLVFFGVIYTVISLIPDALRWISTFVSLFDGEFNYDIVTRIITIINIAIDIVKTCLFLALGIKALKGGTVVIPGVDSTINKYI
ncbi:MAG: hypothetical protein KBS96_06785 [Lachnospiraceae bacterium]|nr:hypothetical protein [Candidatus Colinaster scatohippi]